MMKNFISWWGISVGIFCACSHPLQEDSEKRSVILTCPIVLESVHTTLYPGIIHEAHSISLGFKTAGQIEKIYKQEGDYVRQGELLAELDDTDYRLGVEALQIQYDQLKDEVERTTQLFKQKSVSANDYEKAVVGMKQLGVQLQVNQNKLDYTKLYAPTNGYVQSVNFSPAEMVNTGTALFTLLDVSHMEVKTDIPVQEYRQRERFTRYYCKVAGMDEKFPLKLLSFTPKADGNQFYQLHLTLNEGLPDERLTARMNVEVGIVSKDTTTTTKVAVPLTALFCDTESRKPCVWVFGQDSTVSKRPVVLDGTDGEGHAVVIEGLMGKERIVRAGVHVLRDGERVRVIEKASNTNVGGLM